MSDTPFITAKRRGSVVHVSQRQRHAVNGVPVLPAANPAKHGALWVKEATGQVMMSLITSENPTGLITQADINLTDGTTFVPESPNDTTKFLRGDDPPTWAVPSTAQPAPTDQAASFNVTANTHYRITGNSVVATLPGSPSNNDWVMFHDGATVTGFSVARNGNKIMALSEDMTVNTTYFRFKLVYRTSTTDWRLAP